MNVKELVCCSTSDLLLSVPTQTCSQTELENWITAIHSACATAVARQHHREDTVRLLRAEIKKLEQKIDMDEKMKKMGDMQLSAVTDTKKRKTILDQVGFILLSHFSLSLTEFPPVRQVCGILRSIILTARVWRSEEVRGYQANLENHFTGVY